mmetsp:Transcript_21072/g.34829  ORF Transcript_21072/g.34829 Transcript_21072/m.34829 type:complete len:200 (-) Transcript_21072:480-1079(-)
MPPDTLTTEVLTPLVRDTPHLSRMIGSLSASYTRCDGPMVIPTSCIACLAMTFISCPASEECSLKDRVSFSSTFTSCPGAPSSLGSSKSNTVVSSSLGIHSRRPSEAKAPHSRFSQRASSICILALRPFSGVTVISYSYTSISACTSNLQKLTLRTLLVTGSVASPELVGALISVDARGRLGGEGTWLDLGERGLGVWP